MTFKCQAVLVMAQVVSLGAETRMPRYCELLKSRGDQVSIWSAHTMLKYFDRIKYSPFTVLYNVWMDLWIDRSMDVSMEGFANGFANRWI